jgi:hypothetical protein
MNNEPMPRSPYQPVVSDNGIVATVRTGDPDEWHRELRVWVQRWWDSMTPEDLRESEEQFRRVEETAMADAIAEEELERAAEIAAGIDQG